jgi:hypothetical protein
LIGIISKNEEKKIVEEFFELFKTPWEFYGQNQDYDVVICTGCKYSKLSVKLLIIYSGEITEFDIQNQIIIKNQKTAGFLKHRNTTFPTFTKITTFEGTQNPIVICTDTGEVAGFEINRGDMKILRIGYNLFDEISFLLSESQPKEFSLIPTLDIHISLMRQWILSTGIPVVEIPPVPAGYDYICCLTHDIDFASIRNHKWDHTFWGFLYRATLGSIIDVIKGRRSLGKLVENMKAVLLLPAVHLGIVKDYWNQFDGYREIEKDKPSTIFVIPFANNPGHGINGTASGWRATKYDIEDIKEDILKAKSLGCELGLHGIDAWIDSEKGWREAQRISEISGDKDIGVRMHWLYFSDNSPKILEQAGFYYDSTLGYNDAVGYRNGTTQAFRPLGLHNLIELPLHVQDTAMFYPDRMALSEKEASNLVDALIQNSLTFGGVLTINWHDRSLAPERLWGDFYSRVLDELMKHRAWFGTARKIVQWFNWRRETRFGEVKRTGNKLMLTVAVGNDSKLLPQLALRVYIPGHKKSIDKTLRICEENYFEFPLSLKQETEIPVN